MLGTYGIFMWLIFLLVYKSAQNYYYLAHGKRKSPVHNMI